MVNKQSLWQGQCKISETSPFLKLVEMICIKFQDWVDRTQLFPESASRKMKTDHFLVKCEVSNVPLLGDEKNMKLNIHVRKSISLQVQ